MAGAFLLGAFFALAFSFVLAIAPWVLRALVKKFLIATAYALGMPRFFISAAYELKPGSSRRSCVR